jgi:hypothetical protein
MFKNNKNISHDLKGFNLLIGVKLLFLLAGCGIFFL